MPATGWTAHDAAVLVARQEHIPAAERREMADMLGLLGEDDWCEDHQRWHHTIRPDGTADTGAIEVATLNNGPSGDEMSSLGRMAKIYFPPDRPETFTSPPALRNYLLTRAPDPSPDGPLDLGPDFDIPDLPQDPVEPVPGQLPLPEPPPVPPKPKTPTEKRRGTARPMAPGLSRPGAQRADLGAANHYDWCGTFTGRKKHIVRGEHPCEPCRVAYNTYQQGRKKVQQAAKPPAPVKRKPRPPCGTPYSAKGHRIRGEEVCDACRDAQRAAGRAHWRKKMADPANRAEYNARHQDLRAAQRRRQQGDDEGQAVAS